MSDYEEKKQLLLQQHRKELKDLTSKITAIKKSVSKGDKKKKKEIQLEITILENELNAKHESELKEFETTFNGVTLDDDDQPPIESETQDSDMKNPAKKKNKQKARLEKREKKLQVLRQEGLQDAASKVNYGDLEKQGLKSILEPLQLEIKEITADGHCLYNAIADQLSLRGEKCLTYKSLRERAGDYISSHQEDFLPFLFQDNGAPFTEEEFQVYCNRVKNSAEWGGHLELQALSKCLEKAIHIYQSNGPVIKIGEENVGLPLNLSYHRHAYGLGEHYNSLQPALKDES